MKMQECYDLYDRVAHDALYYYERQPLAMYAEALEQRYAPAARLAARASLRLTDARLADAFVQVQGWLPWAAFARLAAYRSACAAALAPMLALESPPPFGRAWAWHACCPCGHDHHDLHCQSGSGYRTGLGEAWAAALWAHCVAVLRATSDPDVLVSAMRWAFAGPGAGCAACAEVLREQTVCFVGLVAVEVVRRIRTVSAGGSSVCRGFGC